MLTTREKSETVMPMRVTSTERIAEIRACVMQKNT